MIEEFWSRLCEGRLPALLQDAALGVRASACDCLSVVREAAFTALPVHTACQ